MRNVIPTKLTAWFLVFWLPLFFISPVIAQIDDEIREDIFSNEGEDDQTVNGTSKTGKSMENISEDTEFVPVRRNTKADKGKISKAQNAVLEGIQISKEPGEVDGEENVTCYFIFRDKPSSYYYDTNKKQKIIEFEFSDVVMGSSPIPSFKEPPMQGFTIENRKVDINKDVVGLNPEWHDVIKVSLKFDVLPIISVKDEYTIISFSYTWSSKGETDKYVDKERSKAPLLLTIFGGIGAAGAAGAILFLKKGEEEPKKPLSGIDGVINHPDPEGN